MTQYNIDLLVNGTPVRQYTERHRNRTISVVSGSTRIWLEKGDTVQIRVKSENEENICAVGDKCHLSIQQIRHFR